MSTKKNRKEAKNPEKITIDMARVIWLKYRKWTSEQKNVSTKRAEAGTKIASN